MEIRNVLTDRGRMHEVIRQFESRVVSDVGGAWAVGVNSASAGLFASLLAVGVSPGQDVLVPGLAWPGTWCPAALLGARLVPIDLSSDWFVMDPKVTARTLQVRTAAAVVSAGLYGSAQGIDEIDGVARAAGIPHILDAAQLVTPGRPAYDLGVLADLVVISLGPGKPAACGGGGAVIGTDPLLRDRLLLLTQHPVRMYTDTDDISLLPFADGFGVNFQIHPAAASAYLDLKPETSAPERSVDIASAVTVLREFDVKPLLPPDGQEVASSSRAPLVGTMPSTGARAFGALRAGLENLGWMAERCRYVPFDEVIRRRSAIYPWLDDAIYPLRHVETLLPQARRWANELLVVRPWEPRTRSRTEPSTSTPTT